MMTEEQKDTLWQAAIRDAESLDRNAKKTDHHVEHMTDALVLTLQAMYTNDINGDYSNWSRDKEDLTDLVRKIAPYQIHRKGGEATRIGLTAEYEEIVDVLNKIKMDDYMDRLEDKSRD